ncbi:hypothetical protein [Paraburkholderia tropica]|uniref:hypothetical protein n=1 Tax=Paraburkholderia tropica TaxID=92647 RepID=UPI003D2916A8
MAINLKPEEELELQVIYEDLQATIAHINANADWFTFSLSHEFDENGDLYVQLESEDGEVDTGFFLHHESLLWPSVRLKEGYPVLLFDEIAGEVNDLAVDSQDESEWQNWLFKVRDTIRIIFERKQLEAMLGDPPKKKRLID